MPLFSILNEINNIEDVAKKEAEGISERVTKGRSVHEETNTQQTKNATLKTQEKQNIRNKIDKLCRENIWL